MIPEFELWILDELNESYQQTPRMWAVDDQSLQQNPGDLFLNSFRIGFHKQVQECATEVMSVTVWVTQLVGYCIQE